MSKENGLSLTDLKVAALTAHELYNEFKAVGFERSEALELVAKIMMNAKPPEE